MRLLAIVIANAALISSNVTAAEVGKPRAAIERLSTVMLNGKALPFSGGVRVGDVLYLSGQIGLAPDDTVPPGIEAQAKLAMDRISASLKSVGLGWKEVIRCTVMLENMADWPTFNRVYAAHVDPENLPARSAFGVDGLALGALVEVQCEAYAPQK